MDIFVRGTAMTYYKPELVVMSLTFSANESKYDKSLQKGSEAIDDFVSNVLVALEETKECLKTQGYRIQETYRYVKNKSISDGYAFSQNAKIKLSYDIEKMALFIEQVAKLKNPPSYIISFEVNDEDEYKNQVLAAAMKKAKAKAEAIASAVDMKLTRCVKTDFKPFEDIVISNSVMSSRDFGSGGFGATGPLPMFMAPPQAENVAETVQRTFTPEDICIAETVYCQWHAE